MIIKNMPGPTAEAGRKTPQAWGAQNNDHFASELKKQMSSGHKPHTSEAEESSKVVHESKKHPAEDKAQHEEPDSVAALSTMQADAPALEALPGDALLLADGQLQQPGAQEALLNGLEALAPAAAQPSTQAAQSETALAIPVQTAAVLPATQQTQTATANAAPDNFSPASKIKQPDLRGTPAQTSAEGPNEATAKPASFGENMAAVMQGINSQESAQTPNLNPAHNTPTITAAPTVVPASLATPVPVTPAIPSAGVVMGTLQAEVGTPAWQQSLGQQIAVFSRNGIHHAELRLHPEDLGALQISLKVNNDQAQVHFVAESHQVRAALESAMPHLRTMLAESGIQLGQSSVGADTASSSGSAFSDDFSGQRNSGQEAAEPGILAEDERIVQPVLMKYTSGINTFV